VYPGEPPPQVKNPKREKKGKHRGHPKSQKGKRGKQKVRPKRGVKPRE